MNKQTYLDESFPTDNYDMEHMVFLLVKNDITYYKHESNKLFTFEDNKFAIIYSHHLKVESNSNDDFTYKGLATDYEVFRDDKIDLEILTKYYDLSLKENKAFRKKNSVNDYDETTLAIDNGKCTLSMNDNFVSSLTDNNFLESDYKLYEGGDEDEDTDIRVIEIVNSSTFIIIKKDKKYVSFIGQFNDKFDYNKLSFLSEYDQFEYYKSKDGLFIYENDDIYWFLYEEKHLISSDDSDDNFIYTGSSIKYSAFFGEQMAYVPLETLLLYVNIPFTDIKPFKFNKAKLDEMDDDYFMKWKNKHTINLPGDGGCTVLKNGKMLAKIVDEETSTQLGDGNTDIYTYGNYFIVCNYGDVSSYAIIELL
jgi:hypothetical protein